MVKEKPVITFLGDPNEEWEPYKRLMPIFSTGTSSGILCRKDESYILLSKYRKGFYLCGEVLNNHNAYKRFVH